MDAEHSSPAVKALIALSGACDRTKDPDVIRAAMDEMSWAVLDAALHEVPGPVLLRSAAQAQRQPELSPVHRRVLQAIQLAAGPA